MRPSFEDTITSSRSRHPYVIPFLSFPHPPLPLLKISNTILISSNLAGTRDSFPSQLVGPTRPRSCHQTPGFHFSRPESPSGLSPRVLTLRDSSRSYHERNRKENYHRRRQGLSDRLVWRRSGISSSSLTRKEGDWCYQNKEMIVVSIKHWGDDGECAWKGNRGLSKVGEPGRSLQGPSPPLNPPNEKTLRSL